MMSEMLLMSEFLSRLVGGQRPDHPLLSPHPSKVLPQPLELHAAHPRVSEDYSRQAMGL